MSGPNQPILPPAAPDLASLLRAHKRDVFSSLNVHLVGQIVSFDEDAGTASVQISTLKQVVDYTQNPPDFVLVQYPVLTDCPVFFPGGSAGWLSIPPAPGDPCLVLFHDKDLDNWFAGGANTPPNSSRSHDLSDGLVLVGFRNKAGTIPDFYMDGAELKYAGGRLRIADKVALDGKDSTLKNLVTVLIAALTKLDTKTGPSAATEIAAVSTESTKLFQ